jgi:hypothetical protein
MDDCREFGKGEPKEVGAATVMGLPSNTGHPALYLIPETL